MSTNGAIFLSIADEILQKSELGGNEFQHFPILLDCPGLNRKELNGIDEQTNLPEF